VLFHNIKNGAYSDPGKEIIYSLPSSLLIWGAEWSKCLSQLKEVMRQMTFYEVLVFENVGELKLELRTVYLM
jgi:hypothetical protein